MEKIVITWNHNKDKLELPCEIREYKSLVIDSIAACSSQSKKYFETFRHTLYRNTSRNCTFKKSGLHFLRSIQDIYFKQQQVQDNKEQTMCLVCSTAPRTWYSSAAMCQYCGDHIDGCQICWKTIEKHILRFYLFKPFYRLDLCIIFNRLSKSSRLEQ